MPLTLRSTLAAWGQADLPRVLRDELAAQDALFAPLQRAMAHGSHALVDDATLMVLRTTEHPEALLIDAGVAYTSITPGCACEADPTPMSELPEYATLRVRIDRRSAGAEIEALEG